MRYLCVLTILATYTPAQAKLVVGDYGAPPERTGLVFCVLHPEATGCAWNVPAERVYKQNENVK